MGEVMVVRMLRSLQLCVGIEYAQLLDQLTPWMLHFVE